MLIPAMRAMSLLALTLLVPRVLADHEDRAMAADDLALLAHRLDRRSYLHDPFRRSRDPAAPALAAAGGGRYRSRACACADARRLTIAEALPPPPPPKTPLWRR